MKIVRFTLEKLGGPTRLDKALRGQFPTWGRAAVKHILNRKQVRVNGKSVWMGSWEVKNGDQIEVDNPPADKPRAPEEFSKDWLVAEEPDLLVVNKPAGLRAHATRAGGRGNLLSLAEARFGEVKLLHRLDRDTSGLSLLTRPGPVNAYLDKAFKEHRVEKMYLAVVAKTGQLAQEGKLADQIGKHPHRRDMRTVVATGGQSAETRYAVLAEAEGLLLLGLWPLTGRMHQLRVQLAERSMPVLGDRLYGGKKIDRMLLHAAKLTLPAEEGWEKREWAVEPGEDFWQLVPKKLKINSDSYR